MRFKSAVRVVYSTCSVHVEENEGVIKRVSQSGELWFLSRRFPSPSLKRKVLVTQVLSKPEFVKAGWKLERALPSWPRRGLQGSHPQAGPSVPFDTRPFSTHPDSFELDRMVRCDARLDHSHGFFVTCLIRDITDELHPAVEAIDGDDDGGSQSLSRGAANGELWMGVVSPRGRETEGVGEESTVPGSSHSHRRSKKSTRGLLVRHNKVLRGRGAKWTIVPLGQP
jgi:hypothetical protein